MPFNSPFMSLAFSRYVRFVFHVCPVLSLRVISLHLPSCRLVSLCFVSLSFPLHSPCFHFCPLHVPFSSPLFPFHFPLLSCHVDFLFPPLISLHFLAFPLCSPIFPAKKHGFSSVFTIRTSKNTEFFQIFGKRRQEPQTSKEPAGGIEPGTPVLRHLLLLSKCHMVAFGAFWPMVDHLMMSLCVFIFSSPRRSRICFRRPCQQTKSLSLGQSRLGGSQPSGS